jgi:hypothetical protein
MSNRSETILPEVELDQAEEQTWFVASALPTAPASETGEPARLLMGSAMISYPWE